jgi:hypothetical protein
MWEFRKCKKMENAVETNVINVKIVVPNTLKKSLVAVVNKSVTRQ